MDDERYRHSGSSWQPTRRVGVVISCGLGYQYGYKQHLIGK